MAKLDLSWQRYANDEPPGFVGHFQGQTQKNERPPRIHTSTNKQSPPPPTKKPTKTPKLPQMFFLGGVSMLNQKGFSNQSGFPTDR